LDRFNSVAVVIMSIRFEKVLEQIANAGKRQANVSVTEKYERRVSHLQELIRAQDALGDRIVMSLGVALLVSAVALPVYAFQFSNGYAYLPSVIGSSSGTSDPSTRKTLAARQAPVPDPVATGSVAGELQSHSEPDIGQSSGIQEQGSKTAFSRYFIHLATNSSALIEGPDGVWWVTPGMTLPGAGQILAIKRFGGRWSVVTSETTITQ